MNKKDKIKKEKTFEVWCEGFRATGDSAPATYHGQATGTTFKEACQKKFGKSNTYDKKRNTLWGCRLFDNESAARQTFG